MTAEPARHLSAIDSRRPFRAKNHADDWELDDGRTYSPSKLYTKATDGHGHSSQMPVNFPPAMQAVMAALVERKAGYNSKAAFIRDAVVHRIHQLEHELPPDHPALKALDIVLADMQNQQRMERRREEKESVDRLTEALDGLLADGELDEAMQVIGDWEKVEQVSAKTKRDVEAVLEDYAAKVRRARKR